MFATVRHVCRRVVHIVVGSVLAAGLGCAFVKRAALGTKDTVSVALS